MSSSVSVGIINSPTKENCFLCFSKIEDDLHVEIAVNGTLINQLLYIHPVCYNSLLTAQLDLAQKMQRNEELN